jgi:hypothetical protein
MDAPLIGYAAEDLFVEILPCGREGIVIEALAKQRVARIRPIDAVDPDPDQPLHEPNAYRWWIACKLRAAKAANVSESHPRIARGCRAHQLESSTSRPWTLAQVQSEAQRGKQCVMVSAVFEGA